MLCDMPTPSSAPASYLPDLPPPSPRHRTAAYHLPMNFDFSFNHTAQTADQQFQAQLLQRLQSLTGTIANTPTGHQPYAQRPLQSAYQSHLYAPSPHHQQSVSPTATVSSNCNRASQPPSYCASPVANRSTSGESAVNDGIIKPLSDDHHQVVTVVVDRTAAAEPASPDPAPTVLSPPPPGKQKSLLKVTGAAGTGGASKSGGGGGKKTATVVGNGPITRSTSEKVPNKSNLMSHVQRTTWARHTTK